LLKILEQIKNSSSLIRKTKS